MTLRTPETEAKYQEYLRTLPSHYCFFCANKPTAINAKGSGKWEETYRHFFLIENDFPYDAFYKDHYILSLKRHAEKLRPEEEVEMKHLLKGFSDSFDQAIFNFPSRQSVRGHFHIHLLNFR